MLESNLQHEFRNSGYTLADVRRSRFGLWIATWIGILIAGGIAGLFWALLSWSTHSETESLSSMVWQLALAGCLLAACVGVVSCLIGFCYHSMANEPPGPTALAAIAGGMTAFVCMPLLSLITVPLGACVGALAAQLFMASDCALPLKLHDNLK